MTRLLFLSGNIQPIIFIIFSSFSLRNGVFMLTNFNNRKKNRMHIGQLQAFILSMCLVTAGIFGLTGCSDASTNVWVYNESYLFNFGLSDNMMLGSKHANLIYECITYYIYAYQLRCTKQDVLRTSKLLPKVVICINIIRYTC